MSKTIHSLAKGIDVSIVTDAPQSAIDSPDRSELDQLAASIRDLVMTGYSLVPWSQLPERHRNKWREGVHVAMNQVIDRHTFDIGDVHDAITAGPGPDWEDRRHCERVRWLDAAPLIRAEVQRILDKPAPRPARTVKFAPVNGGYRPTLRERLAARKAG